MDAPHEIIAKVVICMEEWRAAYEMKVRTLAPTVVQHWEPPIERWVKANSDGAVSKHGEKGEEGKVLRDHNGAFVAGACHYFPHIVDLEMVAREMVARDPGLHVCSSGGDRD